MLTHEQAVQFIKDNPVLVIKELEKAAGLPKGVLNHVLNGSRVLNEKHLAALEPILRKYGYGESGKAKVISVVNHKGGVGKTTSTLNLGSALALLGKKVLCVDMDSQGNLSQNLGVDEPESQVADALLDRMPMPTVEVAKNYHLAPSDIDLADAEKELLNMIGGFNRLNKALKPLREKYDYILIDCPPALNILTSNAMVASDSCLITLQPEYSAVKGLDKVLDMAMQVRSDINSHFEIEGILFTLVDGRLVSHKSNMMLVQEELDGSVRIFNTLIRMNAAIKESQMANQNIFEFDKASNGAKDYMSFAEELIS